MTPEDKARIEEIRIALKRLEDDPAYLDDVYLVDDLKLLLAQLDEATRKGEELCCALGNKMIELHDAHAALRYIASDAVHAKEIARKALDGSTDPDTGTKGSLGEE